MSTSKQRLFRHNYILFPVLFQEINRKDSLKWVLTEHEYMGPNLTAAEGFILGVGAKMFTIAGPVIVYGVSASVVYGLVYWLRITFF